MPENLVNNGGFEDAWSERQSHRCLVIPANGSPQAQDVPGVFTPPHWLVWFYHRPGEWNQPEVRDVWREYYPHRVHGGKRAVLLFTFLRNHDAGLLQRVRVVPGTRVRLTAWAHAANGNLSRVARREGEAGYAPLSDARPTIEAAHKTVPGDVTFYLGIDPSGGVNPLADTVVWGQGARTCGGYSQVPAVEAAARADTVTVFLRSRALGLFASNDVYWDDVELFVVEEPTLLDLQPLSSSLRTAKPEPSVPVARSSDKSAQGLPRIQYERTYVLAHPGADRAFMLKLLDLTWARGKRWTIGGSADDAGLGDLDVRRVIALRPREWGGSDDGAGLKEFFAHFYPGVVYWPLDWDNDYQLNGRLLAYSLKEIGFNLAYPTTHRPPRITSAFGHWRSASGVHHCGLDLASSWAVWGDEILSATDGVVIESGWHDNQGGFGCRVRVRTIAPDGREVLIRYAHFRENGIYVRIGQQVVVGQKLGRPGNTGISSGDHLHIDVKVGGDGGTYVDPALLIQWPEVTAQAHAGNGASMHLVPSSPRRGEAPARSEQPDLTPKRTPDRTGSSAAKRPSWPPSRAGRTGVLLPPIEDTVERLNWRIAAAIGSSDQMWTVGHFVDDAESRSGEATVPEGPVDREVIAVNPRAWGGDLQAWFAAHYLGVEYRPLETNSPWEMAVLLLPALNGDIALAQSDPRWARYDFGEHPSGREGSIGRYGCFLTGLAIILRKVYQREVIPPLLDKLLVTARVAYENDNLLMWGGVAPLFPAFDDSVKDNGPYSARQLDAMLRDGWEIILRRADGQHFVYLEAVEGNTLRVIDTWDGKRKSKSAADFRGIRAVHVREHGIAAAGRPIAGTGRSIERPHSASSRATPHKFTYVLLPPFDDAIRCLDWRVAAVIGSAGQSGAIGHSPYDAGGGPPGQEIMVVNPRGSLAGAAGIALEVATPWEMAIQLMPKLAGDVALAQDDPRWADEGFGERPDGSSASIGRYGSLLTGLAMVLRKVYRREVTPPLLDRLLVASRMAYDNENTLLWADAMGLFPAFDSYLKDDRPRSAGELARLLRGGWEILLKQANGGRFVYLEAVEEDVLRIVDPVGGERAERTAADAASAYKGIRAAHVKRPFSPGPSTPTPLPKVLVGLHDRRGGEWMAAQGIRGCCLVHYTLQRQPIQVDCRRIRDAGITVICRLSWGYADGTGTLPRLADRDAFINAVVQTMLAAQGIAYFHVGNEPNNCQEWPGFGRGQMFALTPQYVAEIYNVIWHRVAGRVKMGPPPIDPYFGPGSNNRDWWRYILDHIAGADALFLHAKTQTNDPSEVWSRARFTDEPLTWQYLHLRTVETALEVVPERFRALPVFVTELNPQYLTRIGGATGWRPDNAAWVHEALRYFREGLSTVQAQPVTGVILYRYEASAGDQSPFGLEDKPAILAAIKEEANV